MTRPQLLLCESCGYEIGGLAESGNCPECGRPISDSLPSKRPGSPWQIRRSFPAWLRTNYLMVRRPREVFDRIRVDFRGMGSLLFTNLLIAGALISSVWIDTLIGFPARNVRNAPTQVMILAYAKSAAIGIGAVGVLLFLLTLIEALGIMFFGRRRGWRITGRVACQICAHASVGWILAAAFSLLSLVVWLNLSSVGLGALVERASVAGYLLASIPLLGFFAGMFIFELLVYTGVRRCRFANAPR